MNENAVRQYEREKALFKYSSALERGDFETVATVLRDAESDPTLERMILEANEVYCTEQEVVMTEVDATLVRDLVQKYLPSAATSEEEMELPPITVSDVVARMQSDARLKTHVEREPKAVLERLRQAEVPLPENLSQRGVRELFQSLGLSLNQQFQKIFRDTAIFLSLGRQQGMARLAATRRQQKQGRGTSKREEGKS